jgi:hypothetical protein
VVGLRRLAGFLLLASGVTHLSELWVFGVGSPHMPVVVGFGVAFFAIGLFLLRPGRRVLWWGAVLPAVAACLGVANSVRQGCMHPYTMWHLAVDLTVFPICIGLLIRSRRGPTAR